MWNTEHRYGLISRLLHWGIALLFFIQFALGISLEELTEEGGGISSAFWLNLHTTIGILLVLLILTRILASKIQIQPAYPDTMSPLQQKLADVMKVLLNLLLLATALAGYFALTADGDAPLFFGIEMPLFIAPDESLHETLEEAHETLAFLTLLAVLLHAGAAIKHHWVDKDDILKRMLAR